MVSVVQEDASNSQSVNLFLDQEGTHGISWVLFFTPLSYHKLMTAYEKALTYLAIREHSKHELKEKLKNKGYQTNEINLALDRLESENYLSDERFVKMYISSRLKKSPEGKELLLQRLKQKGISISFSRSIVNRYFDENEDMINEIYKSYFDKIVKKKGYDKAKLEMYKKGIKLKADSYR